MPPAGRNDPCPCGSGLKYKKCCLVKNEHVPSEIMSDGNDVDKLRSRAFKAMSEEKWDLASDLFNTILDQVSDPHSILEALAACYDGSEDYLRAAEYYEKTLAVCPESRRFTVTYRLGVSRGCAGRIDKAIDAFRGCLDLNDAGKDSDQIKNMVMTLEEINQGRKPESYFLVQVQLQRAFSDMDAGRFDSASARLEKIASLEPDNAAIYYNLGVVDTFLKREDSALDNFSKSVELNPQYAQAWYNMGQICLLKNRDFSRALHCFDRATAVRPDYIGAHHQRGIAYELLGDPTKAVECWNRTLELDPQNEQAKESIDRVNKSRAGGTASQSS
jgi:tetratricopeptide (TPR) repeat protein